MLGFRVWGLGYIKFRGGFGARGCLGFSAYMCRIWGLAIYCSGGVRGF